MTDMNNTLGEEDVSLKQFFGWLDFTLFGTMLAVSTIIGVYFGFWGKKEDTPKEYLHGGKTMSSIPVAFSVITSEISGVTLMGVPSEIYTYGSMYWLVNIPFIFTGIFMYFIYLPVFYDLQITSIYEYLQLRFCNKVRIMASVLYTISMLLYIPIVIYVPALGLSQVSGIGLHYITTCTTILVVFYTMLGGLKAVVWTDFLQGIIMFVAIIMVIILGVIHAGGFENVWQTNEAGGRIRFFDFDPSPVSRITFWTITVGLTFNMTFDLVAVQTIVQKLLSVATFSNARRSVFYSIVGFLIIESVVCYTGMLIYAAYHGCDPLKTKAISRTDQLATYYVADMASTIPGLPGLYVAGIFSAALSTMSSSLNSMGATMFEDFVKPFLRRNFPDASANKIIKILIVFVGILCLLLVFIVDKLGSILQLALSLSGITSGAMLGVFSFGMFYPRGNSKGALAGSICSLLFMGVVVFGAQSAMANGTFKQPTLPTTIDKCARNFTLTDSETIQEDESAFILFRVSFMYYTLMGLIVTFVVGAIVSHFTEPPELEEMNPAVFTPIVRKYVIKIQKEARFNLKETELLHISKN